VNLAFIFAPKRLKKPNLDFAYKVRQELRPRPSIYLPKSVNQWCTQAHKRWLLNKAFLATNKIYNFHYLG
jgi:hypothetical protein